MKVSVSKYRDRLRLVWSWGGQRYFMSLGLEDNRLNRIVAEGKAKVIEADIVSGNFDSTLNKYRTQKLGLSSPDTLSAVRLFQKFTELRAKQIEARSLEKYHATEQALLAEFGSKGCRLGARDAERLAATLEARLDPVTVRIRMGLLKSAWDWGGKQGWVDSNPWKEIRIKVPPKQRPKPFTKDEVRLILAMIRESETYSHYGDYVEFLFLTGCRTGEAIGLLWKHVDEDYRSVWIGESYSRGKRKPTKTNRDRTIQLSPRLQELLRERRGDRADEDLVFCSQRGKPIRDGNFRYKVWQPLLKELGIEYRKPYITRSTMISHNLAAGRNPIEVAQIVGHDIETMYTHYAGVIVSHPAIRDLYD